MSHADAVNAYVKSIAALRSEILDNERRVYEWAYGDASGASSNTDDAVCITFSDTGVACSGPGLGEATCDACFNHFCRNMKSDEYHAAILEKLSAQFKAQPMRDLDELKMKIHRRMIYYTVAKLNRPACRTASLREYLDDISRQIDGILEDFDFYVYMNEPLN